LPVISRISFTYGEMGDYFPEALEIIQKDAALKDVDRKYTKASDEAALQRTVKSLQEKKYVVHVVDTKEQAAKLVNDEVKANSSVSFGGSVTLHQLGITAAFKERKDVDNLRAKFIAAMGAKDYVAMNKHRLDGFVADNFVSSVSAISEQGDLITADLTGTRTTPILGAKKVILVSGTNKIVATRQAARDRLYNFCVPLESARSRVAYGVPGSNANYVVEINAENPFGPRPIIVVLVRGSYGF